MSLLDAYIRFKANPDNDSKQDTIFCEKYKVLLEVLKRIKRDNPNWRKQALDLRRESYAEQMAQIDKALFEAAICGDTKAADLLYRRFDGWNPKIVEQTNNYYNFADLVKGLKGKKVTHIKREMENV